MDQHPTLMERFIYIKQEIAKAERAKEKSKGKGSRPPPVPKNA